MQKFEVAGHEYSLLPDGEWTLSWADEFDGDTLDETKWDYRTCMMQTRWPAWVRGGVHLDGNSNAVFTLLNRDGKLVSAQLQTGCNYMDEPVEKTTFGTDAIQWPVGKLHENKFLHGPGYYECRCRLQQKPGWWSAFWIQSPIIGASLDPAVSGVEIDVMESFKPGRISRHNVFTGGYGLDSVREKIGEVHEGLDTSVFHRFGLLWDETGYTFYIDGVEDGHCGKHITAVPEFILISTEVRGYRKEKFNKQPEPEAYDAVGDTFLVDHVRVFDKTV
ncbi:MAG: glycoside hydrolase family 16 protein [Oscillospiraceae bacterium]|nr:glycoside hydrolase family 16 protein [Oscillospiraceae bacterium]